MIASEPTNLSSGVRRDITIEVWFNHDLDRTTVTSSTVLLFDLANRKIVRGTVVYAERKISFTPDQPLLSATRYQLVVLGGDGGVKDVFGVPLAQSYRLEFTTSAEPESAVPVILEPAEQSVVSGSFVISWTHTGSDLYDVQVARDLLFEDIYWPLAGEGYAVVYSPDGTVASVRPAKVFEDGFYFVRVRAKDGPWSEPVGFAVASGAGAQPQLFEVVEVLPSPFAAGVSADKVVLRFSKDLDPSTVAQDTVYVVKLPL